MQKIIQNFQRLTVFVKTSILDISEFSIRLCGDSIVTKKKTNLEWVKN